MELVTNWNRIQQRVEAWWNGTLDKGPLVAVYAPLHEPRRPLLEVSAPSDLRQQWLDVDYRVKAGWNEIMCIWCGGDAVPSFFVNLGPGSIAGYLGSEFTLKPDTVWFHPLEDNALEHIEETLAYDPDNELWAVTQNITREAARVADGEFFVSITDIGGALDILVWLRGNQNLLIDLIESPELVHRCQDKILQLWFRYYTELKSILDAAGQEGYTCWMPCWSSRPWYALQCDFSAMISPDMFAEFALPYLREQAEWLDRCIYHLDGPRALPHLDQLLSIEKLDAIQWVAGEGNPPEDSDHWLPYYRRIAEAGKGIGIMATDPDRIFDLSQRLPAQRLAFMILLPNQKEGEAFLHRFQLDH